MLNTAVVYERRKGHRLKGKIDILSRGHGEPEGHSMSNHPEHDNLKF